MEEFFNLEDLNSKLITLANATNEYISDGIETALKSPNRVFELSQKYFSIKEPSEKAKNELLEFFENMRQSLQKDTGVEDLYPIRMFGLSGYISLQSYCKQLSKELSYDEELSTFPELRVLDTTGKITMQKVYTTPSTNSALDAFLTGIFESTDEIINPKITGSYKPENQNDLNFSVSNPLKIYTDFQDGLSYSMILLVVYETLKLNKSIEEHEEYYTVIKVK